MKTINCIICKEKVSTNDITDKYCYQCSNIRFEEQMKQAEDKKRLNVLHDFDTLEEAEKCLFELIESLGNDVV